MCNGHFNLAIFVPHFPLYLVTWEFLDYLLESCGFNVQGGSNMTGTCLHTKQSRSYLNHLVIYIYTLHYFDINCSFFFIFDNNNTNIFSSDVGCNSVRIYRCEEYFKQNHKVNKIHFTFSACSVLSLAILDTSKRNWANAPEVSLFVTLFHQKNINHNSLQLWAGLMLIYFFCLRTIWCLYDRASLIQ